MVREFFCKTWVAAWRQLVAAVALTVVALPASAQVGEHRSELAVGVNGGYVMSNMGFVPKIPQGMHTGLTGGLSFRYTSEKYFSSICAIVAEVNYAQIGWKEDILTPQDEPVINEATGLPEEYQCNINYIQVPVFARLGWGRERKGFQAFFQVGPQIGYYLSESSKANFDVDQPNLPDRTSIVSSNYVRDDGVKVGSGIYHMPVENKVDYGIVGGLGLEFSHPKVGHFLLEGRYYYGLGNIYGDSKRDYFGRSNYSNIVVKLSYLFDILRTNNSKIK
ncbi:MAG: PorT family protein [Prevotella sp.]|nr:PorT family protein [Prevotella sp.]